METLITIQDTILNNVAYIILNVLQGSKTLCVLILFFVHFLLSQKTPWRIKNYLRTVCNIKPMPKIIEVINSIAL